MCIAFSKKLKFRKLLATTFFLFFFSFVVFLSTVLSSNSNAKSSYKACIYFYKVACTSEHANLFFTATRASQQHNVAKLKLARQNCKYNLQLNLKLILRRGFTSNICRQNCGVLLTNEILERLHNFCIHDN